MALRELTAGGIDLYKTLRSVSFLGGDPTCHLQPGRFQRATLTPDGPGSVVVQWDGNKARAQAWGAGANWLIHGAGRLLGMEDDLSTFNPTHHTIRRVYSQNAGLRIGATHTLWHDMAASILQQRVTTKAAAQQWRAMVRAWGEAAPGEVDLLLPPAPALVARKGYFEFHPFGIERQRAETLIRAAREVTRIGNAGDVGFMTSAQLIARLRHLKGIGPWTSNFVCVTTLGDPDVVVPGDFHLPSTVSWALEREPRADDDRMLELLEPFAGHRWRVVRLLMVAGIQAPKFGPKGRKLDIRRL